MSDFYNAYKRDEAAGKPAAQPQLPPQLIGLLYKMTDEYNRDAAEQCRRDNMSFTPRRIQPARMFQIIVTEFAMQYYPEALQEIIKGD